MTQRYSSPLAHERMAQNLCPECGHAPEQHVQIGLLWVSCCGFGGLTRQGVEDRIRQYREDIAEVAS